MLRVSLVPKLVSFTEAPETVAPLASETVPTTVPNLTCASTRLQRAAIPVKTNIAAAIRAIERREVSATSTGSTVRRKLSMFFSPSTNDEN
jgi:hypothetical protein